MIQRMAFSLVVLVSAGVGAAGLPKASIQALIRAVQDTHVEVRTAAALALADVPDESALKPLETALITSDTPAEQDALVKALLAIREKDTCKRLSESLSNPQFSWGKGAKARAVEVIAKIGEKRYLKWLTDIAGNEGDSAVRIAALRALGELGAPPKKENKD